MEIITGFTGIDHVISADDAALYRAIIGQGDYVLDIGSKLEATIIDNNTIKISDGDLLIQGHQARIRANDYEEVTINNGTLGKKRHDLIVARYTKNTDTGVEDIELAVIQGETGDTAQDPIFEVGDISQGATIREFPLYRVKLDGLSITAVEPMFNTGITIESLRQALIAHQADFESLIAGGQSFTAVLEKGWTGNLYYSKNDLDLAHIRGELIVGEVSPVSQIAVLPIAYIPKQSQALGMIVVGQSVYTGAVINQYSQIQIRKPASENIQTGDKIQINMIYQA